MVRRNPSPPRQSGPHPRPRDNSQRSVQNRIMPASTLINPVKKSGCKNSTSSGPCGTRLSEQKMPPFARIFELHANDPARTPLFSMKSTTGPISVAQRPCPVAALDMHSLRWPARRLQNELPSVFRLPTHWHYASSSHFKHELIRRSVFRWHWSVILLGERLFLDFFSLA